jgi:hypothetical protein
MTREQLLLDFLQAIPDDPRITSKHISLYLALIQQADMAHVENPIMLKRASLMKFSKISGRPTYLKCLKYLNESGYLRYVPAPHRYADSYVYLPKGISYTFHNIISHNMKKTSALAK